MNATTHAVLIILLSCTSQGENRYTKVSIDKIQEILGKVYKIDVKRRWIFYCLAKLLLTGYITRKPRYRNRGCGLIMQISSMIWITVRGAKYMITRKVIGAKKLLEHILAGITNGDKRRPKKEIYNDGSCLPEDPGDKKRLKSMLGAVTKSIS